MFAASNADATEAETNSEKVVAEENEGKTESAGTEVTDVMEDEISIQLITEGIHYNVYPSK